MLLNPALNSWVVMLSLIHIYGATKYVKGDAAAGIIITLINLVGGTIMGVMFQGLDANEAIQKFGPVSYTHLDVYKRQTHVSSLHLIHFSRNLSILRDNNFARYWGCLLYTSVGITRSVIVNALRKFESEGVIESRSSGMKGTYILSLIHI